MNWLPFLAQAPVPVPFSDRIWSLLSNPVAMPFLVGTVAIVVVGIVAIVRILIRHRERMAKIEHGIDPDAPSDNSLHR
jgi:hypothetical protein